MLEPDRDQIEIFVEALFRHAAAEDYVSLRSFCEGDVGPAFRINGTRLTGGLKFLIDAAANEAYRAANEPKKIVFCPPIAGFADKDHAREQDLVEGLALSAECDEHPQAARKRLEQLLGPATVVVISGGKWADPKSGEVHPKLHLHWRLARPARGEELQALKHARSLAARIVNADPSNTPICHPIRWPGSWHRKAEPTLCAIEAAQPDQEIDLQTALATLTAAAPAVNSNKTNGAAPAEETGASVDELVEWIISGEHYHPALTPLTAKLVAAGMNDGASVNLARALMNASRKSHDEMRWQRGYNQIPDLVSSAREKFGKQEDGGSVPVDLLSTLRAYAPRAFSEIPRRQWLHAGHYIRQQVVMTIAPGGYGKTALILCNTIEMCAGRGLLGPAPIGGALRVLYWNAEDPEDEVERRIAALCIHYQIDAAELGDTLFLGSKISNGERLAKIDRKTGDVILNKPLFAAAERFIADNRIDCVIFDPLIAFHAVPENDNSAMEKLVKAGFEQLASAQNCCVELSQHTRKSSQGELTADDSRGASAITFAARSVRVLNRMSVADAEIPKIEPEERRHYLRVNRDKTNLAPPGKATWIHLANVELPNGEGDHHGDNVQVATAWDYPQPFAGMSSDDMRFARDLVRDNPNFRADPRSPEWIGFPLAARLKLNANDKGDRKRIAAIIRTWIANKALAIELRRGNDRHERQFVVVGPWIDEATPDNEQAAAVDAS